MSEDDDIWGQFVTAEEEDDDSDEAVFIRGRLTDHVYLSRGYPYNRPNSSDNGNRARFLYQAFASPTESGLVREGEDWLVYETPAGRAQIKISLVREEGRIKEMWVYRVPTKDDGKPAKIALNLRDEDAQRFFDMVKVLEFVSLDGEKTKINDRLIHKLLNETGALEEAYSSESEKFRQLIRDDPAATDVLAMAHRREQVALFHRYLEDDTFFDLTVAQNKGHKEAVWQRFFEANPWILGMSLSGQLLTSWDGQKLEQVTTGRSVSGVGKRIDALLETSGRIRSMVFAEIKHHRTELLHKEYRPGCWSPAEDLAGGVTQVQGTVHRAASDIGERLAKEDPNGTERLGEFAYLLRPKSYLIIGQLSEFTNESGGHHVDKIRSFELYRRNLHDPEIVTFDELLARADWLVSTN